VLRLVVGQDVVWDMLLNPTMPRSAIRPKSAADVAKRGAATLVEPGHAVVRECRIAGRSVADLSVRVTAVVDRLLVDGILGLDFFEQFESVLWRPRAGELVLRFP